jgi:hypothetical protein
VHLVFVFAALRLGPALFQSTHGRVAATRKARKVRARGFGALAHNSLKYRKTASKGSSSRKSSITGTPVLKDPKKINKNAKQLQKVRPLFQICFVAIAASSAFDF